jgi:hypothetical protein
MRFWEAMLEGYGLEVVDFFGGESGIIGYKRKRFGGRHHIRGAWASRLWVRVIIRDFGK